VQRVVKGKSMLSAEIGIDTVLAAEGIEVVETDLGEFIVQLAGSTASHIIAPCIHMDRQQIGRLFADRLGIPYSDDPPTLTRAELYDLVWSTPIRNLAPPFHLSDVGLAKMKAWLGDKKWAVIHFNFGLHDAKYRSENAMRATPEQYLKNLQELVDQMKATGAKLIFATTTPTPAKLSRATRRFDSIPDRNAKAVELMKQNGVAIDDLYNVVLPVQEQIQRPGDVHFKPEGYEALSKAVAASIAAQLPEKK